MTVRYFFPRNFIPRPVSLYGVSKIAHESVHYFIGTVDNMISLPSPDPSDRVSLCKHLSYSTFNHICWVYETSEEHKMVLVDFVNEGFRNNERVVIVYGTQMMKSQILNYLTDTGTDVPHYLSSKQLLMFPTEEIYIPSNTTFNPEKVMDTYEKLITQSLKEGYRKLRAYGDMSFAAGVDLKSIRNYETQLVSLFSRYQNEVCGLCGFPAFVFDGSFIVSMMTAHPKLCIGTESFESNYYFVPESANRPSKTVAEYWISNLREHKALLDSLKQKNQELSKINSILESEKEQKERAQLERQRAEDGSRAQRAFIAMLSHEIRTPLCAMLSTSALLRDTQLTKVQEEYVSMIGTVGEHLMTILNDVLDFSKFESTKIELEDRPFSVRDCITSVIEMFRQKKDNSHITLEAHISDRVPAYVSGDITRLRQVLLNLVGNAIKFTPGKGRVVICADVEDTFRSERIRLRFLVQDTGIGIPKDKFGKIFCDFQQADVSTSRIFGGTGLGLAICKRLVEAMNGNIWFESEVDVGSTFYFTATFNCVTQAPSPPRKRTKECLRCPPLRILVVEDNAINQVIMDRMLKQLGHAVKLCSTGLEAVEIIKEEEYDLILMDLHMPVMDGVEAASRIGQMSWSNRQRPRIVAMTASIMEEEKRQCLQAGMDGFVAKPLRLEQLSLVCQEASMSCKHQRKI